MWRHESLVKESRGKCVLQLPVILGISKMGISRKVLLLLCTTITVSAQADVVKMSKNGICHDHLSASYSRTKHYTAYDSLKKCLDEGGRLPKGISGYQASYPVTNRKSSTPAPSQSTYNRSQFDHWIDIDHDCQNTRQELLIKLSTSTIEFNQSHCSVTRGRWLDPYTGKIFYNARDLDVDHVVPLKWAWEHGAERWSQEKRRQFANDESNLFAVEASINREKGAMGPFDWLPPNHAFHCQYILRFQRTVKKYGLNLSEREVELLTKLRATKCGK